MGTLIKAVTDPGDAAPTVGYDIAITDENGVNVLSGCDAALGDRHTTSTEEVYFFVLDYAETPAATAVHPVVCDRLTISVSNAGNAKNGRLILYYRPA